MENNIKLIDMLVNNKYILTCPALELQRFKIKCSTNQPSVTPNNPFPKNNADDIKTKVYLSWSGGDPNLDDSVTYDIYFGKTTTPPIMINNQFENTYNPGILDENTKYYWRIISKDNQGSSTAGPIWSFTTGESNDNISNRISIKFPNQKLLSKNITFNKIN
jgi:hypothetical protein